MRKLLPTPPRIGEQTQHKHQALRKGKSPQSIPSRLVNYGGLGEPESSKHFCAEITVFASLCSVIFGKRGPASDCLTFFSYLARFLFENAEMPHFRAAFLLCIFFINTIWSEWRDLNPRPLGPEPSALPTALHPDMSASKSFPCPRDSVVYYTEFFGRCQVWKWVSHLNLNLPGNRGTRKSCPPALLFLSESPVTLSFCLSGPGR